MQYHQDYDQTISTYRSLMQDIRSENFRFLEAKHPELAILAAFAEQYVHSDPPSAIVKLRTFAEKLLQVIFNHLAEPWPGGFFDALGGHSAGGSNRFLSYTDPVIKNLFHILRKSGNKAAHDHDGVAREAQTCLENAHKLAQWYFCTYLRGKLVDAPKFQMPESGQDDIATLKQELLKKEAELASFQSEAEQALQQKAQVLEVLEKSQTEILELKTRSANTIDALEFSEADTRKYLIDGLLLDAGWKVGKEGEDTASVGQEVELQGQGTKTGIGYADYVLYDDNGDALAVIEAKKTSVNPTLGLEQARQYAAALAEDPAKRPIIFLTNGYDIFLYDEALGRRKARLWGIPSPDSLKYRMFHRQNRKELTKMELNLQIAGGDEKRGYARDAVLATLENFQKKTRRSLLALATGTGKTRIATSISDVLLRANWAKRILFLCDRLELRKQAKNTFTQFLRNQPATLVTPKTYKDRNQRLYFGTYPSMIKCFENFDVGFFDLIIADESHRSIYKKYRDLFHYFDALYLGLTATPLNFIERNTFSLFGCEKESATHSYSLEEAIDDGVLVPPTVFKSSTQFSREGICYNKLDDEQKAQAGDQVEDERDLNFGVSDLDKRIFNKDTNRTVLRNIMEHGVMDKTGHRPGKTIVFARNHDHAVLLHELFEDMYADDYGDEFCKVIDYHDTRASSLIDDFKSQDKNLTIAISVDMLDTGIDVPEVVNLSFAKPLGSRVKFLQMLGRGTRLCPNLFGPSQDKTDFRVFDHWGLFLQFEQAAEQEDEKPRSLSVLEKLFTARIDLLSLALQAQEVEFFEEISELVRGDINALKDLKCIAVREKMKFIHSIADLGLIQACNSRTLHKLRKEICPLMFHRDIRKSYGAYSFDLLVAEFLTHRLQASSKAQDFAGKLANRVRLLPVNIGQVKACMGWVKKSDHVEFWMSAKLEDIEETRIELRELMNLIKPLPDPITVVPELDITDKDHQLSAHSADITKLAPADFKSKMQKLLQHLMATNSILQKIRKNEPVSEGELEQLSSLVLTQSPELDLKHLTEFFPESAGALAIAVRSLVGLDSDEIRKKLEAFTRTHPLSSRQHHFIEMLVRQISKAGGIKLSDLWEAPFTTLDSEGIDGIFPSEKDVDYLLDIIKPYEWPGVQPQQGAQK